MQPVGQAGRSPLRQFSRERATSTSLLIAQHYRSAMRRQAHSSPGISHSVICKVRSHTPALGDISVTGGLSA
jgi:hypothetical protein